MILFNTKDKLKFEKFLKVMASLTGEELNVENISKVIGIDNKTVNSWINICLTGILFLYYLSIMKLQSIRE